MNEFVVIQNDCPRIKSTSYWESSLARKGFLYLSVNAGACRLLVPPCHAGEIREMKQAKQITMARGRIDGREVIELVFDDGTDNPYVLLIDHDNCDRCLPVSEKGRVVPFLIYTSGNVIAWEREVLWLGETVLLSDNSNPDIGQAVVAENEFHIIKEFELVHRGVTLSVEIREYREEVEVWLDGRTEKCFGIVILFLNKQLKYGSLLTGSRLLSSNRYLLQNMKNQGEYSVFPWVTTDEGEIANDFESIDEIVAYIQIAKKTLLDPAFIQSGLWLGSETNLSTAYGGLDEQGSSQDYSEIPIDSKPPCSVATDSCTTSAMNRKEEPDATDSPVSIPVVTHQQVTQLMIHAHMLAIELAVCLTIEDIASECKPSMELLNAMRRFNAEDDTGNKIVDVNAYLALQALIEKYQRPDLA